MKNPQELSKSIKSAASFLNESDVAGLTNLIDALEKVYVYDALDIRTEISDEEAADRLVRIVIPLESELYQIQKNEVSQDLLRGYSLIASIFEYAAKRKTSTPTESRQFWVRASLAYLQAKKTASSIVCAKRAGSIIADKNDAIRQDLMQVVLAFLSRELHVIENQDLKNRLTRRALDEDFGSVMEQSFVLASVELLESLVLVCEFLKSGSDNSREQWLHHMRLSLSHFQKSGDDYFIWLTSRLIPSTERLLQNSLWNLRPLIPSEIISAFTLNEHSPIYDLWDNQVQAVTKLLDSKTSRHQSLIMPTSAGKTLVATIVAAQHLLEHKGNCFYVTPFRALVSEIAEFMNIYMPQLNIQVGYLPGRYDAIPELENIVGRNARMIILTPEKLDLLWRLNDPRVKDSAIFIFDEIQNIAEEGRGLRLELLVSKIKKRYGLHARILLLSAVIPESNLGKLVEWLGNRLSDGHKIDWKPTRVLDAIYWRAKMESYRGDLHYLNKFNIAGILPSNEKYTRREDAVDLALRYARKLGPVLIYCNSRDEAEHTASLVTKKATSYAGDKVLSEAARTVESVMGRNYPLAEMIGKGIAYHHSSLPDSLKKIIENLCRTGVIRVLTCTSTLAEGVNLSVGTVIVSSTYQGSVSMDGLKLRNLAGRAGRALKDTEGHVVLMEAAARQSLTEDAYAVFESRFFQYLSSAARSDVFDTDVDALESDLLARFHRHDLELDNLNEGTVELVNSTLFYRQASTEQVRSALSMVQHQASKLSHLIPKLSAGQLQVFAETGLGIRHCQSLDEQAHRFAVGPELRFRDNQIINYDQVNALIDACLLPSSRYGPRIQRIINDPKKIIQLWLMGKDLVSIASAIEANPSSKTLGAVTKFLYGYVADDVSWANAALIKLIDNNISQNTRLNLDYEFYLLPSYLKYGVNNPCALLIAMSGLEDRDLANKISMSYKSYPGLEDDWIHTISWILGRKEVQLEKVKTNLLSSLGSFSIPINNFSGSRGLCEITPGGTIAQSGTPVGTIDKKYIPILAIMATRACTEEIVTNDAGGSFVQISPA